MQRRPLKSRGKSWAIQSAKYIASTGMTPNQISILSIVFSIGSTFALYFSNQSSNLFIAAAIFVQLRLLCNLLDGMVAIEHNKKSSTGDIFNDAPDRIADILTIIGLGLAIKETPMALTLSWAAACFAVLTAYIRALGISIGTPAYFTGPMAKPHRMFLATLGCLLQFIFIKLNIEFNIIYYTLLIILTGSALTSLIRLSKIYHHKKNEASS